MPEIAAGALQLLPLAPLDAVEFLTLMQDPEVARWRAEPPPTTLDGVQAWVRGRVEDMESGRSAGWTVRTAVGGELAGFVTLHHLDGVHGNAEVGFWVDPAHRRQGVARTSVDVVSRFAFQALGLHRIALIHAIDNPASCSVARSCGYALEGTTRGSHVLQRRHVDEHLHARIVGDPHPSDPSRA